MPKLLLPRKVRFSSRYESWDLLLWLENVQNYRNSSEATTRRCRMLFANYVERSRWANILDSCKSHARTRRVAPEWHLESDYNGKRNFADKSSKNPQVTQDDFLSPLDRILFRILSVNFFIKDSYA